MSIGLADQIRNAKRARVINIVMQELDTQLCHTLWGDINVGSHDVNWLVLTTISNEISRMHSSSLWQVTIDSITAQR